MTTLLPVFDPYDYGFHEDPYPTYEWLRRDAPLYRNEALGFWALSRHADVLAAFRDAERFSSADGVSLDPTATGPHASKVMSFLAMDDPRHFRMRSLVTKGFTPRRVQALEERVREITREHLDAALQSDSFDFIVIDFPDPTNYSLGKLYTTTFYKAVARHLSAQGLMVVQSTSPMFARDSYWCIAATIKNAGLKTYPYHVYVPSFGEWGFVIASTHEYSPPVTLPAGLRFVDAKGLPALFQFPPDMAPLPMAPNRLNDQVLVRLYDKDWKDISH